MDCKIVATNLLKAAWKFPYMRMTSLARSKSFDLVHSTNCSTLSDFCTTFYWYANFILNNFILTSWSQPWTQHITETSSKYVRLKLGWPLNLSRNGITSESFQSWDDLIRLKLEWPLNSSKAGMTSKSVQSCSRIMFISMGSFKDIWSKSFLYYDHPLSRQLLQDYQSCHQDDQVPPIFDMNSTFGIINCT